MAALHIQLLGGFNLVCDGAPVTSIFKPRQQSLLAYLLLHRQTPQARHHLAFTFWPDASESRARNNLRQALHQLRHSLPSAEEHLYLDANIVQWRTDSIFQLDVAEFEETLARAETLSVHDARAACEVCQQAVRLYGGDLLPSCYDEWIAPERERLQQLYRKSLQHLIQAFEARREYA
jgi:DNA-binding SARP family transcriptional activator